MSKLEEIKTFFKQERQRWAQVNWPGFTTFLNHFAKLILLVQFIHMAGMLFELRQNLGMMYSRGDDASHAVYVATKTKWYNMNGWYAYGPVYYRITHTFAKLVTGQLLPGETANEANEANHHFMLTLVSLVSLFGIAYLISRILLTQGYMRYLATAALVSAFTSNSHMSTMIFTAHPDYIAIFMMMLALYFTSKMVAKPESQHWFIITALFWGLAASTKMIFVYFMPITPFFWKLEKSKAYFKRLILFYSYMFAGYLAIGFPQNFRVDKVLIFMKYMSGFTRPITWEFFKKWMALGWEQFHLPVLVLIVFALVPKGEGDKDDCSELEKKPTLKIFLLTLIPLGLILSRRLIHHYYHYLFPFGMVLMMTGALVIRYYKNKLSLQLPRKVWASLLIFVIFLSGTKYGLSFIPQAYYKGAQDQKGCWNERKLNYDALNKLLRTGGVALTDPKVSYNTVFKNQVYRSYSKYIPDIKRFNARWVVLSGHSNRYYAKNGISEYIKQDLPRWREILGFYNIFRGKSETTDPYGGKWRLVYEQKECAVLRIYERYR